jgi:Predicted membrane protein (DUF2142)
MHRPDVKPQTSSVRLLRTPTIAWAPKASFAQIWTRVGIHPTMIFVLLSLVFGVATAFVVPPLRGPDEIAHFLRIHSYARGEIVATVEVDGRKGLLVERNLHNQLQFFKGAGEWFVAARDDGVRYGEIMAAYDGLRGIIDEGADEAAIFMPFAGTEGYNPVAYIPYVAAAAIGRVANLEFPNLLLLMRLAGVIAFTAVAAYAIAVTPVLRWAFVLIALLPVSLYNRSVLSADGAALSTAMVITALCLAAAHGFGAGRQWQRSSWMTLCALSKQPQIVFVLLELMVHRLRELPRRWWHIGIVVLPACVLSPLWVVAVSAEIAAWRLQLEEYHPPEHFNPIWQLHFMWENPSHFPLATWRAITEWGDRLWQELIGIVGWQDVLLPYWTYLLLTVFLVLVCLQKPQLYGPSRARVVVIAGLTVLTYVLLVYLIFFLTYTPLDIEHVRGVQGRYFIVALPAAAIFIAAVINFELPYGLPPVIATAGSLISGIATVEALFHAHW